MDIAKEITVINLGRAKEPSKPTWCVGPWELFLSWASPRRAFGLRSVDIRGCRPARFAMRLIEGQKEGAVIMENGLAEMHAQRSARGVVTKPGGPPGGGSRNAKNEDLLLKLLTPEAVNFQGRCP